MKEALRKTVLVWVQILPLIGVGGWTVYRFQAEQHSAQARLARLECDQRERHAREDLVRPYVEARSIVRVGDGWIVAGTARFTNKGGADYDLNLGPHCLRLARVDYGASGDGAPALELRDCRRTGIVRVAKDPRSVPAEFVGKLRIRAGADGEFYFFFRVDRPGIHLLEFMADYTSLPAAASVVPAANGSEASIPKPEQRTLLASTCVPIGVVAEPVRRLTPADAAGATGSELRGDALP